MEFAKQSSAKFMERLRKHIPNLKPRGRLMAGPWIVTLKMLNVLIHFNLRVE